MAAGNKYFVGKTDGTLTWDDKGFVYDSGDQSIAGTLTLAKNAPYLNFNETDIEVGTVPGSTGYQGINFRDKNSKAISRILAHYSANKNSYIQVDVFKSSASTDTASAGFIFLYPASGDICFRPETNGLPTLGTSSYKWKEIWCTQNSINSSSDERIKQQITNVPDEVLDAWGDVSWIQFKFNDACEEKGAEQARLHNGLIAQRIDEVFRNHGLDASKYGLFLYDAWEATPEERDKDGKVMQEAQPAGDAYGLRYTEALCMEAAYQRRRADRAEARLADIEARLAVLEAKA
jgi:hypothetical protein